MYAAHKAAGGMTSVYRQIGIGCESLVRTIIRDKLGLSATDARWSYDVPLSNGKTRTLYLDARIDLSKVKDVASRQRFRQWMDKATAKAEVDKKIAAKLGGTVFEVRQGYKSKDSKRQNADIANAATAYAKAYFPCALILSAQIDGDVLARYRAARWSVLTGTLGSNDPLTSTYDFMRLIIGYDLAAFFERHRKVLRTEIDSVLKALLTPTST